MCKNFWAKFFLKMIRKFFLPFIKKYFIFGKKMKKGYFPISYFKKSMCIRKSKKRRKIPCLKFFISTLDQKISIVVRRNFFKKKARRNTRMKNFPFKGLIETLFSFYFRIKDKLF